MKNFFVAILILSVVAVLGFSGYRGYSIWSQAELVSRAKECLEKGNSIGAMIALRNVMAINRLNPDACRLMGDFAETDHSPEVVQWRQRLLVIDPESFTNHVLLARAALEFGDLATAQKTLDRVNAEDKKTSTFYMTQGAVYVAGHSLDLAEAQFTEALKLEPDNSQLQLNLALIRLQSTNTSVASVARNNLEKLSANRDFRAEAFRQLALDALRHSNAVQALTYSRKVVGEPNASLNDRLFHLNLLRITQDSQQSEFLGRLQAECVTNSQASYQLGKWLLQNLKPEMTMAWIKTLPLQTRTNLPMPFLETDCHMLLKDWSGLLSSLSGQNWGAMDCGRLVACVRAYKELDQLTSAKITWIQALQATDNQESQLQELLDASTRWKWPAEQLEVLWVVVNHFPDNLRAVTVLSGILYSKGQTSALMRLSSQCLERHENELELMNNLAATALLLEAWEKKPHQLAYQVYTRCPTNASYMTTYAYSLLLQKKPAEALKIMEQINPSQLENPGLAAYYGVILAAAGKRDQASHYLDLALHTTLLPEERKLVERAIARK